MTELSNSSPRPSPPTPLPIWERGAGKAILLEPKPMMKNIDRRAFMKLPMAERQKILAAQAEAMKEHYKQNTDWQDWVNLDIYQYE